MHGWSQRITQLDQQNRIGFSKTIQCALTGMVPQQDHLIEVFSDEVLISQPLSVPRC